MDAVIVAAGEGKRLRPLTTATPKCLLPIGGKPLIEYSLRILEERGVERIGFVVGYLKEQIIEVLGSQYTYIFNPFYTVTNNMASLWFAKHFIGDHDFIYLHSDLLYHPDILTMTMESDAEIALAVEKKDCDKEAMKVVEDGGYLVESSKEIPLTKAFGEWTGITRFSSSGWGKYLIEIEHLLAEGDFNAYDTKAMTRLARKERIIKILPFQVLPFIEIDDTEDLKEANDKLAGLSATPDSRNGGL
jgi:L-glutamine-phosphate cytidylyltransferase